MVLDLLDPVEGNPGVGELAVRGRVDVEGGAGRVERQGHLGVAAHHRHRRGGLTKGLASEAHHPERGAHSGVEQAPGEHLRRTGNPLLGDDARRLLAGRAGLGIDVEEHLGEAGTGHAVDDGVVHLGEQRHPAALEALDHPGLPERLAAVELQRRQLPDELLQLPLPTRRGHADPTDVELRVELGILDPAGPIDPERDVDVLPAQLGHVRDPRDHHVPHPLEREVRGIGRVDDEQARDVHVPVGCLGVQERSVLALELLHVTPPSAR